MRWWSSSRSGLTAVMLLAGTCAAQQLIGYVPKRDATVAGSTDELDGQAVLMGSASVTAKDHTAPIRLSRGGTVNVCQTSQLNITESREVSTAAPLLFSLDRGAIELETTGTESDSIMTPDLRFTIRNGGPLDLRMRVSRNGDTCVDNRGPGAPTLGVSDAFGEATYEVGAGQHVLFQRGSLRQVVDHETTPCGCPEAKGDSIAEALLAPGTSKAGGVEQSPQTQAATEHPFPVAQSPEIQPPPEGQAAPPPPPAPASAPQISDALSYSAANKDANGLNGEAAKTTVKSTAPTAEISGQTASGEVAGVAAPAAPVAPTQAPKKKEEQPPINDVVHIVARVFRKLFR
jgi:hypothetical protein